MENTIIAYFLKANLAIVLFYLIYRFVLQNDTMFHLRRAYLLLGVAIAFTFQFIPSPISVSDSELNELSNINISELMLLADDSGTTSDKSDGGITLNQGIMAVWLVVALFFTIRLIIGFYMIMKIRIKSVKKEDYGISYYQSGENIIPFSFFGWIFLSNRELEDKSSILKHEMSHTKGLHTLDLLLIELTTIILWYNPTIWLLRRSVRDNLEFLADRDVLLSGTSRKEYQYGLLRLYSGMSKNIVATYFSNSQIKKRIIMMNKKSNSQLARFKYAIIPMALLLLLCLNPQAKAKGLQTTINTNDTTEVIAKSQVSYSIEGYKTKGEISDAIKQSKDGANKDKQPLYIVDGRECSVDEVNKIDPNDIQTIHVLNNEAATDIYGKKGIDGVMVIVLKEREHNKDLAKSASLYMVDGKEVNYDIFKALDIDKIESITVLKEKEAVKRYGERAKEGVIIVTTK